MLWLKAAFSLIFHILNYEKRRWMNFFPAVHLQKINVIIISFWAWKWISLGICLETHSLTDLLLVTREILGPPTPRRENFFNLLAFFEKKIQTRPPKFFRSIQKNFNSPRKIYGYAPHLYPVWIICIQTFLICTLEVI